MTRRKFISLLIALIFVAAVSWPFIKDFNEVVRKILRKDLAKLNVSEDVLDKFLSDAKRVNRWNQFSFAKKMIIRMHFSFGFGFIKLPYHHKYLHYKNIIMEDFLMSTDFVVNGMDETKEIKYLGLFNPYIRYCFNPFSSSFYNA
jgi:hypothetical protein